MVPAVLQALPVVGRRLQRRVRVLLEVERLVDLAVWEARVAPEVRVVEEGRRGAICRRCCRDCRQERWLI